MQQLTNSGDKISKLKVWDKLYKMTNLGALVLNTQKQNEQTKHISHYSIFACQLFLFLFFRNVITSRCQKERYHHDKTT